MTTNTNEYTAVRVTQDSAVHFEQTRARFDALVPAFDSAISVQLVIDGASWPQVEAAVNGDRPESLLRAVGRTGRPARTQEETGERHDNRQQRSRKKPNTSARYGHWES